MYNFIKNGNTIPTQSNHDSLIRVLKEFACKQGVNTKCVFGNSMFPDVLSIVGDRILFLGDAKDANNESPDNNETSKRVDGYIREFCKYLLTLEFRGGFIAIGTNSLETSFKWKQWLEVTCKKSEVLNPMFSILNPYPNTYIIFGYIRVIYLPSLMIMSLIEKYTKTRTYDITATSSHRIRAPKCITDSIKTAYFINCL